MLWERGLQFLGGQTAAQCHEVTNVFNIINELTGLMGDLIWVAQKKDKPLDPARFESRIASPEIKAKLRANTDELIARGGFGSPTMFVDHDDLYFGNDRLELVREALARRPRAGGAS